MLKGVGNVNAWELILYQKSRKYKNNNKKIYMAWVLLIMSCFFIWSIAVFSFRKNYKLVLALGFSAAMTLSSPVNATMLDFWTSNNWILLDDDDGVGDGGFVNPGWGDQIFDAEYLFYQKQGNMLAIGLQTGFDVVNGQQVSGSQTYYAGDLALGFNNGGFNYAIDFGFVTKDSEGDDVGAGSGNQDIAGLYSVTSWNNDINFPESSPFAMDGGNKIGDISSVSGLVGDSYYRTAVLDLDTLGFEVDSFSAHWTMSCGNDAVEGRASVPEPGTLLLMAGGLLGLLGSVRRRSA
jgi:hypothetical protein